MLKVSKYIKVISKNDDAVLLYNTFSGALVEVERKYFEYFHLNEYGRKIVEQEISNKYKEICNQLKDGSFLVDDRISEIDILKYLSNLSRYSLTATTITILPTLDCNFRCSYCYEEHRPGVMKQEVLNKITEVVEKRIKGGSPSIYIAWYGGEPLLCLDIIEELSRKLMHIAKENNITFSAEMITNGYLLNKNVVGLLQELKIGQLQVTLDGPPEIHNKKRTLRTGGETFWKIIENVAIASEYIPIALRINVDKTNMDQVNQVLDILCETGLTEKKVLPYLGFVRSTTSACKSISPQCLTEEEFALNSAKFIDELYERGFKNCVYPTPQFKICGAVTEGTSAIDPDGNLFKCWETVAVPEEAIGNILEDRPKIEHQLNLLKWMNYDPFANNECIECDIFPICFGGCPSSRIEHPGGKVVIDPDGYLYKCYIDAGDKNKTIGHINKPLTYNNKVMLKYLSFRPWYLNECQKCSVFPLCFGHCIVKQWDGFSHGLAYCSGYKDIIQRELFFEIKNFALKEGIPFPHNEYRQSLFIETNTIL
jgi:uncharacterized protein